MRSSELASRVQTGLAGGVLLVALIFYGGLYGIYLVTAVLALGMVYEFCEMTFTMEDRQEKRYLLLLLGWLVIALDLFAPRSEFPLLVFCFLGLFSYFLVSAERYPEVSLGHHFRELMFSVFGLVYLVFLPLFLPRIREAAGGLHWTVVFFLIVWAGDSAAYFVGMKYGKRRLYPKISPKKTIEGALGGLGAGLVICVLYRMAFFREMSLGAAVILPLLVGAVAQLGDLCESFLKRAFDRKDSGSVLPGHGGFLDRFDGVVFALPVMYAGVRIFG